MPWISQFDDMSVDFESILHILRQQFKETKEVEETK